MHDLCVCAQFAQCPARNEATILAAKPHFAAFLLADVCGDLAQVFQHAIDGAERRFAQAQAALPEDARAGRVLRVRYADELPTQPPAHLSVPPALWQALTAEPPEVPEVDGVRLSEWDDALRHAPLAVEEYRRRLAAIAGLDHVTIEINHCRDDGCQPVAQP